MILYRNIFTRIHFSKFLAFSQTAAEAGGMCGIYTYTLSRQPPVFPLPRGVGSSRGAMGQRVMIAQAPGDYSPQAPGPDIDCH